MLSHIKYSINRKVLCQAVVVLLWYPNPERAVCSTFFLIHHANPIYICKSTAPSSMDRLPPSLTSTFFFSAPSCLERSLAFLFPSPAPPTAAVVQCLGSCYRSVAWQQSNSSLLSWDLWSKFGQEVDDSYSQSHAWMKIDLIIVRQPVHWLVLRSSGSWGLFSCPCDSEREGGAPWLTHSQNGSQLFIWREEEEEMREWWHVKTLPNAWFPGG